MRRVQQTVEAKASGTQPGTSSPTMAGLVRQTQMPFSAFKLMRARQPTPVAQARRSRSMMVKDCGLLAQANSLVRFEGWQLPT